MIKICQPIRKRWIGEMELVVASSPEHEGRVLICRTDARTAVLHFIRHPEDADSCFDAADAVSCIAMLEGYDS